MTLIPALMTILDRRAWWLDRILPNLDIEGASLEKHPTADSTPRQNAEAATARS